MDSQYGEKSNAPTAYGSGGATGHFDPITFIKKPQVALRLLSLVSESQICSNYPYHCLKSNGQRSIAQFTIMRLILASG
jgi:hypothetical protein